MSRRTNVANDRDPIAEVRDLVDGWSSERPDLNFDWANYVVLVHRTYKHLRRDVMEALPGVGCGNAEFEVVVQLRAVGPPHALRPTDLFQALGVTSGAMTGRIDRLAALGWVKREPSPSDRRAMLIRLTDAGVEASDRLMEYGQSRSVMAKALAQMPNADRKELKRLMENLYELISAASNTSDLG